MDYCVKQHGSGQLGDGANGSDDGLQFLSNPLIGFILEMGLEFGRFIYPVISTIGLDDYPWLSCFTFEVCFGAYSFSSSQGHLIFKMKISNRIIDKHRSAGVFLFVFFFTTSVWETSFQLWDKLISWYVLPGRLGWSRSVDGDEFWDVPA